MIDDIDLKNLHTNQRLLVVEMQSRGINVDIVYKDIELIKAEYGNHIEWILDRDSSITPYSVSVICGDKYITKRILEENEISVPMGEKFFPSEWEIAIKYAKKIGFPVVVKPVFGSHGDNIYMDIENESELYNVVYGVFANKLNVDFIVEKQFDGKEYRVFLTKNGDYAVLHREPAHIIGDGIHTIAELIEIENSKRESRVNCLCPIAVDEITEEYMKKNNILMSDIPDKNEKIYLRHNSNVAKGGLCIDYTEKIHSSVIENCKRILNVFSGLSYVGIDYMSKDIEANQTEDMYNIVEVNTVPGIHMHMRPSEGKARNVAKYMVDMIFPETKE